ncbi:hypothetical protein KUF71_021831 [Frankliniella fusca]|uniref:Uncharacterized protein n=1 Tax=Frankliniella fusca TaxID=407009 RepID=A0AAE1LA03_9NEOP|nr:hypothetical protein KUF71_021831 [Frankliniella fusca]
MTGRKKIKAMKPLEGSAAEWSAPFPLPPLPLAPPNPFHAGAPAPTLQRRLVAGSGDSEEEGVRGEVEVESGVSIRSGSAATTTTVLGITAGTAGPMGAATGPGTGSAGPAAGGGPAVVAVRSCRNNKTAPRRTAPGRAAAAWARPDHRRAAPRLCPPRPPRGDQSWSGGKARRGALLAAPAPRGGADQTSSVLARRGESLAELK